VKRADRIRLIRNAAILGLGFALSLLGIFLIWTAYSAYQTCFVSQASICNSTSDPSDRIFAVFAVPLAAAGGIFTALGATLPVILIVITSRNKKTASPVKSGSPGEIRTPVDGYLPS
jgi:hypothetical protein